MIDEVTGEYILVIDTDSYAGNFERQMVAFMSGIVGECERGRKEAAVFKAELPGTDLEEVVISVRNEDDGAWRPASIYPSPRYWNDGYGNVYSKEVALDDPTAVVAYNKGYKRQGPEAEEVTSVPRAWPAYHSVACFLSGVPDEDTINLLVGRAKRFCAERINRDGDPSPIEFLGARMVTRRIVTEETEVDVS